LRTGRIHGILEGRLDPHKVLHRRKRTEPRMNCGTCQYIVRLRNTGKIKNNKKKKKKKFKPGG
jgi:hypothetical protein